MAGTQPERPMILGNCISCNGLMRVPVTTDVSHVARCPHCDIRFPVQQLIASAIPAAEILEGEVAEFTPMVDRVRETSEEDGDKPRTRFAVPKQLHDGAKHRRRRRRRSRGSDERKDRAIKDKDRSSSSSRSRIAAASVPMASTQSASNAESTTASVASETSRDSSSSRSSSSRSSSDGSSSSSRSSRGQSSSRRSSSSTSDDSADSSIVEWLKIVVGGMIAFPLAYLGLMWILGLDPFGLAPTLKKAVPFVVPPALMEEESLPYSSDIENYDSDVDESLPKPTIDPDDVRG